MVRLLIALPLALAAPCYAALYTNVSSLPSFTYDFVIVGGGTAGNVVANRLTEDPRTSVLVIEAGPSNECQFASEVPFIGVGTLFEPNPINWNYTTINLPGLQNRSVDFPRGFVLGGSSSINGMVYTRGSADDYDRYARVTGDEGWSWNNLIPYIFKNELWTKPIDNHNTTGRFNPAVHGFHGINSVSLPGFPLPIDNRIIKTTQQLPDIFPFNLDINSGMPLGLGWAPATIKNGVRSSSATSYLAPKFLSRPNLHVLINSRVTRLVKTSSGNQPVTFRQVEFTQGGPTSEKSHVIATKEVILSAGAVNTPFLLQLSGIGDKQELTRLGIQPIVDLPSVGKNATDHPVAVVTWLVNSTDTFDELARNVTLFNENVALWNASHGGLFGINGASQLGWKRLADDSPIFKRFQDPSAGPNSPHIEMAFSNGGAGPTGNGFGIGIIIVSPASRGSVSLSSNDPFQQPLIDTGVFSSEFDLLAIKEGMKLAQKFVTAPVWQDYIIQLLSPNATTEAELDDFIRSTAITAWHLVGTAAMSAPNAGYGVVNPDLKVKGVAGLRIVDASILPFIPAGHTQAATYIIAERASDLIKASWSEN